MQAHDVICNALRHIGGNQHGCIFAAPFAVRQDGTVGPHLVLQHELAVLDLDNITEFSGIR